MMSLSDLRTRRTSLSQQVSFLEYEIKKLSKCVELADTTKVLEFALIQVETALRDIQKLIETQDEER